MIHIRRGVKSVTGHAMAICITLAAAMRAANVAGFYMTKYQSKPQEKLGSIMQPFLAGMRRIEVEEATETGDQQRTILESARRRVRRFIFSASRTMWFSACEFGVFLTTGSSCVKAEPNTKVFSGKGIAMMHECKRVLNHNTAAEGLLLARDSIQRTKATSMDAFLVPQPADTDGDADSDATECPGSEQDEDGDATERAQDGDATENAEDGDATEHARGALTVAATESPRKNQRVSEEQPGDATERADYSEDVCDERGSSSGYNK
jgi:HAMP domain-containing protein